MNYDNIRTDELIIGENVVIDESASIRGVSGNAKSISIGDNVYIGASVQIITDEFSIGDYSKIHHHTNIHGYQPCKIGHNAWIGQYTIIDSIGGTTIGDNCGIGAHSQLWSHIKYGDTLEGCKFLSEKSLVIGKDVWFVGHCIVSPIVAQDKSMALVGSVITKDMKYNHVYAGSPAKDVTDKTGGQFIDVSIDKKFEKLNELLKQSGIRSDLIRIVKYKKEIKQVKQDGKSYFCIESREYTKTQHPDEVQFMQYLLPDKAKFVPIKYQL